jgi:formate dehydrogenase iron-sulfur subunit
MLMSAETAERTLVDALLDEQRDLSAVARFSGWHDSRPPSGRGGSYRRLIPASAPRPGEQFAFEVDLDRCSGCKACVTACHALNGLDDGEAWRSTGVLISTDWRAPVTQVITTACHHCVDPGCLNGCPVLAYDKDPVTGIVRHLDDQCIGCRYCVMMCPYDVPQYSAPRGIVRKCDLCSDRLAAGEAPACAQACPNEAIRITIVSQDAVRAGHRNEAAARVIPDMEETASASLAESVVTPSFTPPNGFLPSAPDPSITLPTTRYVSRRLVNPRLEAGDAHELRSGAAHPSLTAMLVLTQSGVGLSCLDALSRGGSPPAAWAAAAAAAMGMAAGAFHLGRPLKAWRGFLGWRKSWLSRELITFALFIAVAATRAALGMPGLSFLAAGLGLAGVVCSAMVYVDTRRPFWTGPPTFGKFFGTTMVVGNACAVLASAISGGTITAMSIPVAFLGLATVARLAVENRVFRHLADEQSPVLTPLNKSALLLANRFGFASRLRVACSVVGGMVLPAWGLIGAIAGAGPAAQAGLLSALALVLCLTGEFIERSLFFVAEVAPKMPGGVAA